MDNSERRFTHIRGAMLNVLTLRSYGNVKLLAFNAKKLKQDFVLVQETRRNGSEDLMVNDPNLRKWRFIGLGVKEKTHHGVGILLSPRSKCDAVVEIIPGRIILAYVTIAGQRLALISAYAPTEKYTDSAKQSFWNALSKTAQNSDRSYKLLIGGDFNATIMPPVTNEYIGDVMAKASYDRAKSTSHNGTELLNFCPQQSLYAENTFYPTKKVSHQWTFRSSNSTKYTRRLDYILCCKYLHVHSTNCRSYDSRLITAHKMVVIDLQVPSKFHRKATRAKAYSTTTT